MTTTPSASTEVAVHTTSHSRLLTAPPDLAYQVIADVSRWPYTFGPTVHARREDAPDVGEDAERIHLWAFAHDRVRSWTSLRRLDPRERTVEFRQERSPEPLASMGGRWTVQPVRDCMTRVILRHDFTLLRDDAESEAYVREAVDTNSNAELDALVAAISPERAGTVVKFADSVTTHGDPDAVYAFLRDAGAWPERLPHVSRLELDEPEPGIQIMEMDTRPPDGEVHTTRSVRVCLPDEIVYKQTTLPPVFAAHTGRWEIRRDGARTEVTSHHTVVLRRERIADVLGPDATLEQARTAARETLGANSRTTLAHAAEFAVAAR